MKNRALFIVAGLSSLSLAIGLLTAVPLVSAQAAPGTGGQALEIAPPVINLTGNPGQTIVTQISLRDISNGSLLVNGQVNDFVASGEDGTPKILLEDDGQVNPYSLKGWIATLPELLLKSKQIKNLPVTIKIPASASPGGYYGVVRFTATPPELKGTGVSLSASLGSLILIKVNGYVKESMAIEEFSVNHNGKTGSVFESTPIEFVERLKNNGNIHEQPSGQVVISDMFGKKVAAVNINLPPRNVLPQSIRKFSQPLDNSVIGNKQLFGRYTAELRVTYGDSKTVVTSNLTFWVIPYTLIGLIIAVLVGGFIALRFAIRRYNHHIIGKAQKSRR